MEVWEDNGLREVTFRTVIPYDTVTYVVEFLAGEPLYKSNPETIRAIVATFAIGQTEWNMPLITIGVVALLLVLKTAASRSKPSKNYTLFTLPEDEEEGGPEEGGQATDPPPPAGSTLA